MTILYLFLVLTLFYIDDVYSTCGTGCAPITLNPSCYTGCPAKIDNGGGSTGDYCLTSTSATCQAYKATCSDIPSGTATLFIKMAITGDYEIFNDMAELECQNSKWMVKIDPDFYEVVGNDLYCMTGCNSTSVCPEPCSCGVCPTTTTVTAAPTTTVEPTTTAAFTPECTTGCTDWADQGDCFTGCPAEIPQGASTELCITNTSTTCQAVDITCTGNTEYPVGDLWMNMVIIGEYGNINKNYAKAECRTGGKWWAQANDGTYYEVADNKLYCLIACPTQPCPPKPPCGGFTTTTTTTTAEPTTTTTAELTTTTTVDCVWSEWAAGPGTCNDTCGMCGYKVSWERTCPAGCTCDGNSTITEYCPAKTCTFPRGVCCHGYGRIRLTNGTFICINPADYTTAAPSGR